MAQETGDRRWDKGRQEAMGDRNKGRQGAIGYRRWDKDGQEAMGDGTDQKLGVRIQEPGEKTRRVENGGRRC